MDGFERIRAHCEWLELIGMPPDRVCRLEAQMVRAWSAVVRERRAEVAMIADGATVAAERLGCGRATIYRRSRKYRELQKRETV